MSGRGLLTIGLALLLGGCPRRDDPPPAPPPRIAPEPAPGPAPPRPAEPAQPGGAQVTERIDRERLLAMTPEEALAGGIRGDGPGGLAPLLAGEGAIALSEQLRAASVPPEALDLCLVVFDRARSRPGPLDGPTRDELRRALSVQAAGLPVLLRWTDALAVRAQGPDDLRACVAALMKVRELRALSDALPR